MASSRQHGQQEYGTEPAARRTATAGEPGSEDTTVLDRSRAGRRSVMEPSDGPAADSDARPEPVSGGRGAAVRVARTRRAHLRIVHIDPWSVMKTAFLLSIALGIVVVVAVAIIWGVLGAAGVWDSINSAVGQVADSPNDPTPFDITQYIGTSRVVGFALIASVIDVVLITAIATLGAFVYNLAASLVGGVEMTFSEDR